MSFGLTDKEYGDKLTAQGGVCAVCRSHQRYQRLASDHDHKTGKLRGLLCMNCNRGIGRFFDSSLRLRAAADYLDSYKEG